jgi:polysaccharide export outer membrane protein
MTRVLLLITAAIAMAGAQPSASLAQTPADKNAGVGAGAEKPSTVDTSYILGPGDVLDLGLVGRGDWGSRVRVSADGTILLPLIGRIPAAKRTVLEIADDIRQALIRGAFFSDPIVRAEVAGISSRYVTVLGFVGSPGLVTLDRAYRLSEILARVGGRAASGADYVVLTRAAGGEPARFPVDALASGRPEEDPLVANGDKIFIPSAENEVFFISGQVNSPGSFTVTPGTTVRRAIAKGGGVTPNGSEKKVTLIRDGQKLKGVKLEDTVKVGDIITIGERLF